MPGTIRLHIDQFDETAKTWADTSGNGYHATATNAPARAMQNGLAVAEFVKSEADEFVTAPVPAPTTSATFLFVGYLPPSENNEYDGLMLLRDGYAGALATGLFVSAAGGVTYVWDNVFTFAGVARSNELALYAVTISPTQAKVYRIDSSGTIVATNTAAHNGISFSQNRPLFLGDDNTIAARNTNFKARFFEYYQNQVLTQIDLEGIYQFLIADDIRPSDVTGLDVDTNRNITSNPATDNFAVTGYLTERRIGGGAWLQLTSTSRNFQDNENLPTQPGVYLFEYRRKAYDAKNNQSLNWSNIASFTYTILAPIVTITTPLQNAILAGTVNISATVANFPNLAGIKFYIDDTQIGAEDTNSPYSATLDTTSFKNGDYTLRAVARDTNNNQISTGISIAVFNLFAITDTFIWDRVKRPEYYFASSPDWEAVTRTRTFEDGSSTFNELNDTAPRTWELRYTGLTPEEDRIFEDHFILKRISRSFNFVAKNGQTFADVFYKESVSSHDANRSWINTRTIILIKYP